MEFEVKQSQNIEDGKHTGVVDHIEYRTEPYEYTDVYIKENETGFLLKFGCPSSVTEKTKLGKLLSRFKEIKVGEKVNPEKILIGREVNFVTVTETTKDGDYVKIADNSIKPIVTTETIK